MISETVKSIINSEKWELLRNKVNNQIDEVEKYKRLLSIAERDLELFKALYDNRDTEEE